MTDFIDPLDQLQAADPARSLAPLAEPERFVAAIMAGTTVPLAGMPNRATSSAATKPAPGSTSAGIPAAMPLAEEPTSETPRPRPVGPVLLPVPSISTSRAWPAMPRVRRHDRRGRTRAWSSAALAGAALMAALVLLVPSLSDGNGSISLPRIPIDLSDPGSSLLPAAGAGGDTSAPGGAGGPGSEGGAGQGGGAGGATSPNGVATNPGLGPGRAPGTGSGNRTGDAGGSQSESLAGGGADAGASPPTMTTYTLAPGVDIAGGSETAWRWNSPTRSDVRALAGALNVNGPVVEVGSEAGGGWNVAGLALSVDASGQWYLDTSGGGGATACATTGSKTGMGTETAVAPTVEGSGDSCPVPTGEELTTLAAMARRVGVTTEAAALWDPTSSTYLITYLVGGQPSGVVGSLWVSGGVYRGVGTVARPELVGRYPTLSAGETLARLTAQGVYGSGGTIVITAVDKILVLAGETEGRLWSLPGYRYRSADGVVLEAQAVEDSYFSGGSTRTAPVEGQASASG